MEFGAKRLGTGPKFCSGVSCRALTKAPCLKVDIIYVSSDQTDEDIIYVSSDQTDVNSQFAIYKSAILSIIAFSHRASGNAWQSFLKS